MKQSKKFRGARGPYWLREVLGAEARQVQRPGHWGHMAVWGWGTEVWGAPRPARRGAAHSGILSGPHQSVLHTEARGTFQKDQSNHLTPYPAPALECPELSLLSGVQWTETSVVPSLLRPGVVWSPLTSAVTAFGPPQPPGQSPPTPGPLPALLCLECSILPHLINT